jgi:hypothetical protein
MTAVLQMLFNSYIRTPAIRTGRFCLADFSQTLLKVDRRQDLLGNVDRFVVLDGATREDDLGCNLQRMNFVCKDTPVLDGAK